VADHRILVVGVGSIGERHVRCFGRTGRATLAIAEPDDNLRAAVADRYRIDAAYPSLDDALADKNARLDAVLICTPSHLHIPMARQVVAAGLHVLIEKPLSTSENGAQELLAEIQQRGLKSAVAYTYRAHPVLRDMRDAIRAGRFGKPVQLVSTWGQHFPKYRPAYREIYYTRRATGGGAIQDVLTHAINAGEFLVGPADRLMADAAHCVLDGVDVEDTVHVIARHGPVLACYSLNQHQAPNENTITVICDRGTARFELHAARWLSMTEPGGQWTVEAAPDLERDDIFVHQANLLLDMLDGKGEAPCTVADALQTLRVNLAVLAAADNPRWRPVRPN
jgi:predicted dehydrogenase